MKPSSSLALHNNMSHTHRDSSALSPRILVGGLSTLLLLLGIIGLVSPEYAPQIFLSLGVLIPIGILIWYYPTLGLIGLIFLTASILQPDLVDLRLPIGGGLDLRDLGLLVLLGVAIIRNLAFGRMTVPWFPVGGPLLLFMILALLSVVTALMFKGVPSNWALNDFRILFYYCLYFITAWSIRSLSEISMLLIGLLLVADLTSAIVIIQQFRGAENLLLESMAYGQWQVWAQEDGTVRVVPPGHVLMHFMMLIAYALALFNLPRPRRFLFFISQFLLLAVGLILTFTRAGWIASIIGLVIVTLVAMLRYKEQLPRLIVTALALGFILFSIIGFASELGLVKFNLANSLQERFASIFTPEKTLESYSLQWRVFELEKATIAINKNPILGVSLGNTYRNITTFQGEAQGLWTDGDLSAGNVSRYTRYIHSSYLSIATKMGLTGIFVYLWFCLAFITYGFHTYRRMSSVQMKGVVLAVIASFIGLMQWSIFHAWLIETESTSVIGVMIGLVAGLRTISSDVAPSRRSNLQSTVGYPQPIYSNLRNI